MHAIRSNPPGKPVKPTVLITGGAGYIGSHVVLSLLDGGWPVVVLDNLCTGFRFAVPETAVFYEGDIADRELVTSIINDHDVDAIMHFAGSVVVPESVADPLKYYDNNTGKSRVLITAAVQSGVRHFVFSSTAAAYGIPESIPVSEAAPKRPINPYGWSKIMTEQMLQDTAKAHEMNYGILRYFNVAGADPRGRTGQSTKGATHLIKIAVEAALGKRPGVAVFGTNFDTGDGTGVRDYIHVSDLAQAHLLTLEAMMAEPLRNLTLNCGYGRGYSVLDVLNAVDRVSGMKVDRQFEEPRPGDPAALIADNSRILETIPWMPEYADLEVIVEHALAWERSLDARRKESNITRDTAIHSIAKD
ncbi:UDP-glucose 4-epimerase GalE [Croceicoccus marinus]|uniref:UDP-glucose 4-epimerase n=1 Tax=Croceicoccus marinus TaxID=450378 RepID=A0A7G6VYE3_9SPHN|nr:UDP-glucose 4-epimerase GalE [Croceicoccus marinus]QNE06758.1 UDP-glucose 4-epimerase GalE [Croceicoccus marinus]